MSKFVITRTCQVDFDHEVCKFVAIYDNLQDALDDLYRQAHRHGLLVEIDNTIDGTWGFCLWQIYVQVGVWRYRITEETEDSFL